MQTGADSSLINSRWGFLPALYRGALQIRYKLRWFTRLANASALSTRSL